MCGKIYCLQPLKYVIIDTAVRQIFLIKLFIKITYIKLFNYRSENIQEDLETCRNNFIVIDNADILINDEIRRFINFEFSNQYMLFLRNYDGLNVSDKSFKVLELVDNKITLEEEV